MRDSGFVRSAWMRVKFPDDSSRPGIGLLMSRVASQIFEAPFLLAARAAARPTAPVAPKMITLPVMVFVISLV